MCCLRPRRTSSAASWRTCQSASTASFSDRTRWSDESSSRAEKRLPTGESIPACRRLGCPGRGSRPRSIFCPANPSSSRSEEHTSELQSQSNLVCRLLLEKKKKKKVNHIVKKTKKIKNR